MQEPAPPGIDAAGVTRFLAERVAGAEAPLRFALIGAGRSNLTYRVESGQRRFVLRRPPLGHVLPTAHDMSREHRVLSALADSGLPVPRPLALCEDPAVTGAPFYVMEYRPGVVIEDRLPEGYASTEGERRRMGLALVGTLAALHSLDFAALGLSDFGRPAGYLERQVTRWARQWERSQQEPAPIIDELSRRLRAALPRSGPPALVHGDFRLGNLALAPEDPGRVVAIYDWEMATLGDPLADLGYALVAWGEPGESPSSQALGSFQAATALPGFPRRAELAEAYARQSGRDLAALDFYQVLALYKLAVIAEGIYARHRQGKTVGESFRGLTRESVRIAERALVLADGAADGRLRGA